MPYANNNGVRIYYEVDGQGPPLVLAHGGMGNIEWWRQYGYVSGLCNDFQLVLFDLRGHGRSDKPHGESAYGVHMVHDVTTVLDDLGIGEAHYWGYSGGAWIGLQAAIRYPTRFTSFIFGAEAKGIYYDAGVKAESERMLASWKLLQTDPNSYLRQRETVTGRPLSPEEKGTFTNQDAEALVSVAQATFNAPLTTNKELSRISVPVLICCGELDVRYSGNKEAANHIPNARFVSLQGLDHFTSFFRSEPVIPHVKEFLARVNKR
jgi:pimeloyl-ACP methyl ester carboxylesterase